MAAHTKTVLSFGHFHDSWFMDIGDSAGPCWRGPIERSKHDVGSDTLNMSRGGISSNAPCIMSCLRPLTQKTPSSSTVVVRSPAKPVKFWTAVMRGLLAQSEMNGSPII